MGSLHRGYAPRAPPRAQRDDGYDRRQAPNRGAPQTTYDVQAVDLGLGSAFPFCGGTAPHISGSSDAAAQCQLPATVRLFARQEWSFERKANAGASGSGTGACHRTAAMHR